jgi:nitrite reductase/ring-hydroxylating ferredoxin subunit
LTDLEQLERALAEDMLVMSKPESQPVLPELPTARYTSAEFDALEKQYLWSRTWLCAGRTSQLPNPGDFMVFRKAGPSILLVRGKDGELRAFYNTCRHRGAPVVRGTQGHADLLRCQFHSWTYNLEGRLIGVPGQSGFPGLDRSQRGLIPVRCETAAGWIFTNLDANASSLTEFLGCLPNIEIYFLGPHWGEGQRPEFYEGYFAFFDQLMAEDLENIPLIQESLMSGSHASSLLHCRERRIYWLHQALDDQLGRQNIPEPMQIAPGRSGC